MESVPPLMMDPVLTYIVYTQSSSCKGKKKKKRGKDKKRASE